MLKFVVAACLATAAAGQQQFAESKNAKILKEQRFNAGDGRFGSAYAQEDGVVFREETGAAGERVGQYSYIGDNGQTYTVKYSAGKDGFRILDGSHVPTGANGLSSAPFNPEQAAPVQPATPVRQQPAPAFTPQQAPVRQQAAPVDFDYADEPVDPNRNPFINPHDPTHRDFQFNVNGGNFAPAQPVGNNQFNNAVPNCADCGGVNPFINPFDASHKGGNLAGHQAGFQAPAPQQAPVQPAFNNNFQPTTSSPKRFFPPGKLNLNRFETGFNFGFASQ